MDRAISGHAEGIALASAPWRRLRPLASRARPAIRTGGVGKRSGGPILGVYILDTRKPDSPKGRKTVDFLSLPIDSLQKRIEDMRPQKWCVDTADSTERPCSTDVQKLVDLIAGAVEGREPFLEGRCRNPCWRCFVYVKSFKLQCQGRPVMRCVPPYVFEAIEVYCGGNSWLQINDNGMVGGIDSVEAYQLLFRKLPFWTTRRTRGRSTERAVQTGKRNVLFRLNVIAAF